MESSGKTFQYVGVTIMNGSLSQAIKSHVEIMSAAAGADEAE